MTLPILSLIVPCYNEEEVLPLSKDALLKHLNTLIEEKMVSPESFICFVDDGSQDRTWELIEEYQTRFPTIRGIRLSRNFGHQNALMAGLFTIDSDIYVTIDADLQDDVSVIREMILRYSEGDEIIYGVRKNRSSDSFFKKFSALAFYKIFRLFGGNGLYNHADYRLMSRRAVEALKDFSEVNLFLRGIIPLLGFRSSSVYYDRVARKKGESKYPLKKMVAFAIEGITSFSITPLRIISILGFIVFLTSTTIGAWAVLAKIQGKVVRGWLSMFIMVSFMGGIQILSLGIIGEYIGKIYRETKRRPRFIIDRNIGFSKLHREKQAQSRLIDA